MSDVLHQLRGVDGAVLVVRVPSELNHEWAEPLRACVMRHLPNREGAGVVLDFTDVKLISSIGIAALLQVQEHCRDREAKLVLAAVPARQLSFFKMLKLERKFGFAPNLDEAVSLAEA